MEKLQFYLALSLIMTVALATNEEALKNFVKGNNLFTSSLYKEVAKNGDPNVLISPYSAEVVLALLQSGCKGATAEEIRTTLHLPKNQNEVEEAVKESISVLKGNDLYTLHTANKIYVKENFSIKPSYQKIANDVYKAPLETIDFVKNVEAANKMNQWVEEQTANKIKNLIKPDILNQDTRAVLINALYFKGNWSVQFSKYDTRDAVFNTVNKETVQVPTMHHHEKTFRYHDNTELDAKFLELPFLDQDVSMVFVLPNVKDGVTALETQLEKIFVPQDFTYQRVNVALPKFKIESTIPLVKILKTLGIKKVFDLLEADLSGIAGEKGDLAVSDALQKTYIDVEEGGVEAAAATYVATGIYSAGFPKSPPKEFIADHPFLFYLKAKNIILFAGKVSDPRK